MRAQHPDFAEASEDLELEPAAVRHLRIHLGPRFELASIRGRVVDGTGRGVGGANVGLEGAREWSTSDRSSPDGGFRLRVPVPGSYEVVASHPLHAPSPAAEVEVTAGDVGGVVLELAAGATVHGRLLGLETGDVGRLAVRASAAKGGYRAGEVGPDATYSVRGLVPGEWTVQGSLGRSRQARETVTVAAAGDDLLVDLEFPGGHRIRGVVLLDGRPLPGAHVSPSCGGLVLGSPRTGLDGAFAFEDVPPGSCDIGVHVPGSPALGVRRDLEVDADEEVVIEIESASLDGTVADAVTGAPLAGAELELLREDAPVRGVESTRSDPGGRFSFPRLAAGSWRIRATAAGYAVASEAVEVAGALSGREIRLPPTAPLVLEVRTPSGRVPAFVTLEIRRGDEPAALLLPVQSYRLDRESRLVLESLPAGRYRLRLAGPWGAKTEVEVEHPDDGAVRIVLEDG